MSGIFRNVVYQVLGEVSEMSVVVFIVLMAVYWFCPKYVQAVVLLINLFVPDAIPVIDEAAMVAGMIFGPS